VNKPNNSKPLRITSSDISRFTAVEQIRPAQFVHGAFLVSGATVVVLTLLSRPVGDNPSAMEAVLAIGLVGLVLWLAGYFAGMWLFKKRTSRQALEAVLQDPFRGPKALAASATDADKISHHLRKTWAVRTGAWEVGPVVCLLAVQVAIQANLVAANPNIMTTGMIPMLAFAALGYLSWPTRKRQAEVLEKAFLSK